MTEKVKVRIAVAVGSHGCWEAKGCGKASGDYDRLAFHGLGYAGDSHYWIEAELDFPVVKTIQAKASKV